ncbi:MAG TPA: ABC transporter permease subunit [Aggregatilineales bacterium]|nr:ABC transporter permease subunit [Aggregatilineales bacterium]
MASTSLRADVQLAYSQADLIAQQRRARVREAFLGLLFVVPATLVTVVFGLFPVLYGFFISMQTGVPLPQGFIGLTNYLNLIGSLAYLFVIGIALLFFLGAYGLFRTSYHAMQAGKGDFYRYLVPGLLASAGTLILIGLFFTNSFDYALPALILIGAAIILYFTFQTIGHDGSDYIIKSWGMGLFILTGIILVLFVFQSEIYNAVTPAWNLLSQAVLSLGGLANRRAAYIAPLNLQFTALLGVVASAAAVIFMDRAYRQVDPDAHPGRAALLGIGRWIMLAISISLLLFIIGVLDQLRGTMVAFNAVTPDKLASLTGQHDLTTSELARLKPDLLKRVMIWPEVFSILLGAALLAVAFSLWRTATRRSQTDNRPFSTASMFGIALLLMVGGWLFISELPDAASLGDPEFFVSMLRTVTYTFITIPIQLAIGLLLAYLLFHEVDRGKSLYRLIFFIPYVAPTVATAAVFTVVFSLSADSPSNLVMRALGLPVQQWLRNPSGVFQLIAQWISGPQVQLPSFLVGPTLPLLTAIAFSVWVFSGYNTVIFLAGLGAVPKELYEAAQVDGAGRWGSFRFITFPMISPTTFFLTVLSISGSLRAFEHLYVLRSTDSNGTLDTAAVWIFEQIRQANAPVAAAASFILFAFILAVTILQSRVSQDVVFYG